jgi:arsenate reductase-like glutaredoxin family protein
LFKQPLSEAEIRSHLGDRPPADWFATRSPRFKELGLAGRTLSGDEMIALMAEEPYLVRRPSFATGGRLNVVGMDEKSLLTLT